MYERVEREEVLAIIERWGALQPLEIRRKLGKGETTMIGATLSELAHNGRVAISQFKRGTSPFYYLPSKPETLERAAEYLGEKDKLSFALLKSKGAIDTTVLDPLTRVSLGNIKDFSYPFKINVGGEEHLCYRYFLINETQAKELMQPSKKAETPSSQANKPSQPASGNQTTATTHATKSTNTPASQQTSKHAATNKQGPAKSQKTLPSSASAATNQKTTAGNKKPTQHISSDDKFMQQIIAYCKEKNVQILKYEIVRKEAEIDLTFNIPSTLGRMRYYCKAKAKKKSNDGDVAGALLTGQRKQLPVMYLTTGEVTKKAKELPELKGVLIKEI